MRKNPRAAWHSVLAGVVVMAAILVIAGCGSNSSSLAAKTGAAQGPPASGGTLRIGWKQALVDPDPHTSTLGSDQALLANIYAGLTQLDPKTQKPVGDLAKSWAVSRNRLTWTFKLRPGLTFDDGQPVQAEDVKYSIDRILSPSTKATIASDLAPIARVQVISPLTVAFHLKQPYGILPNALAIPTWAAIVPRGSGPSLLKKPDGAGPFMWSAQVPNTSITLKKFPGYWSAADVHLNQLDFKFTPNADAELAALQSNQLNFIDTVPLEQVKTLQSQSNLRVAISPRGGWVTEFGFNDAQKPFNDVRVRQAIAMAINKSQVMRGATYGFGKVASTMVPPASPVPVSISDTLPYNPTKAKQLLAQAGVSHLSVSFSACGGTSFPDMVRASQVIAAELHGVGINASTMTEDASTWSDQVITKKRFQAFVCSLVGGADPDTATYRYFRSDGVYNFSGYPSTPQLDKQMLQARETGDPTTRSKLYDQIWSTLAQQVPWIPIYSMPGIAAMQSDVVGYIPVTNGFDFADMGFSSHH